MEEFKARQSPFGTLWSLVSHLLPLSSAIAIFLSIWQLKGYLGHFDLLLVNVVSLNDAVLHFFIIVSWFLPLVALAAIFMVLPPRGRMGACLAALGLALVCAIAGGLTPAALAGLLHDLGLNTAVAEATAPLVGQCGLLLTLTLALGAVALAARSAGPGRARRLAERLRLAADCLLAPLAASALVLLALGIGELRGVAEQARFFDWPGAGGVRYRARVTDPPPRLVACTCGAGVIWSGDRTLVLNCGRSTLVLSDRSDVVLVSRVAAGPPPGDLTLADLGRAGGLAEDACRKPPT